LPECFQIAMLAHGKTKSRESTQEQHNETKETTMGMNGYNLGAMVVGLHEKIYDCKSGNINHRMDEIDRHTENLSLFTDLLTAINTSQQTNKARLDLSDRKELVDQVREICPDLLPTGVYTWESEDSINLLKDNIIHQSKRTSTIINPLAMFNTQDWQDINEFIKACSEIVKAEREQRQRMVSNQKN